MKLRILVVSGVVAAMLASLAPAPKALADGGASTRNILLGVGAAAATLIIINHNKQVHEKYAQDAATQATLASQRDDAQAAYRAEVRAYNHEVAVSDSLKKEVSLKDQMIADQNAIISQQKQQLAQVGVSSQQVAVAPAPAPKPRSSSHAAPQRVASTQMISYGWGTL